MTPSTTYLHTKSMYILKISNLSHFPNFQIVFMKKYVFKVGWTATPPMKSSFLIASSVPYKMTQILNLHHIVYVNDNELCFFFTVTLY